MIFLPVDLFTPYIKGREMAIDENFEDLKDANQVEQGWLNNDAAQLKNWFTQDTYGDNLARSNAAGRIDQNRATGTDLQRDIALAGQPGALAQAQMGSDYQVALREATAPYTNTIAQNNTQFTLGQSVDRAAQGTVAQNTALPIRTQQADNTIAQGQLQGQQIQASQDLLPLQTDATRGNLELQNAVNNVLQQNPQALFPQTSQTTVATPGVMPVPTGGNLDSQIYSQVAGLPAGRAVQLNIGGAAVTAGRDNVGAFVVENGQKRYLTPAATQSTTTQQGTTFSFGGLK